ncbi:MAG: AAA family ATPase [Chloroflexota bacterium]
MQLSILLLAAERNSAAQVAQLLSAPGHGVTVVATVADLLNAAPRYSLVVLDRVPAGTTMAQVIAELRANTSGPVAPILAISQTADIEERIGLLEANADDVLTRPFDAAELAARVEALAMHAQRTGDRSAGRPAGRRVIAVFSPKGGVGTTSVAANLSLIAAERHPNQTLLMDLDLSFGQVASHLNLTPKQTVLELARDVAAQHDPELFRTYAIHHPGNLQVLAAPPGPGFSSLISPQHIEQILTVASEAYEVVIIDAGTALDERAMTVFGRSDTTLIPVLPEIPALNSVHVMFDQLSDIGALGGSIVFVLNNAFARELLKRNDIETALGAKIAAELPYDPLVYLKAVNEGVPVVRGSAKSAPAEKLRALADVVLGPQQAAPVGAASKEKRGLFGRR